MGASSDSIRARNSKGRVEELRVQGRAEHSQVAYLAGGFTGPLHNRDLSSPPEPCSMEHWAYILRW